LKDFDGEGFEEQRETAVLSGPRRHDGLHPVIRAAAPRQSGDQFRRELHRVEVPPTPLFRVIGQPAGLAAFRAGNTRADVRQPDFDSPLIVPNGESFRLRDARRRQRRASGPSRHTDTWSHRLHRSRFNQTPAEYFSTAARCTFQPTFTHLINQTFLQPV
jgi:hypothetical protein